MSRRYMLKVEGPPADEVARLLGRPSLGGNDSPWTISVDEDDAAPPFPFADEFAALLDGKVDALRGLADPDCSITAWVLYEYKDQCNLEFSAAVMEKLAAHGVHLCVSCWQR